MLVKSKVGPQLNIAGNQDATKWLLKGRPSVAVGIHIGPPGEIANQDIHWVYRIYEADFQPNNPGAGGYSTDPVLAASQYVDRYTRPYLSLNPWVRYVTSNNEPVIQPGEPDVMIWYSKFLAEYIRLVRVQFDVTAVVGNWSVGNPDYGLWIHYRETLSAVVQYRAVLGRHSYGPLDPHYALRHRTDNAFFTDMGFKDLPVMLTEAGWENLPEVGFRAWATNPRRPAEEYVQYLLALDHELRNDSYCIGASVFTYGLGWEGHNINDSRVGEGFGTAVEGRTPFDVTVKHVQPLTNQIVLNAVGLVGKKYSDNLIGKMPNDLLDKMVQNRTGPYTGPNPRTWGLTAAQKDEVARLVGL